MSPELPLLDMGLTSHLGVSFEEVSADECVVRLDVDERHHQPLGVVHGGIYCTLVETAASTAAAMWAIEQGRAGVMGVANSTDFFRPQRSGTLEARATPVHRGRSQQVWQVTVNRLADGALVARGQVRLHNLDGFQPPGT
jgi:uncharacterized protein (TIGR00369 family)